MTEQDPPRKDLPERSFVHELASVTAADHGRGIVVTITGEVDISNIDGVAGVIYAQPNREDGLVVDLSAVRYLDSSAISVLHDVAIRLRGRAQRLIVVSPPDTPPRRVLEMTALYVNAPVADSLESGLKLLGNTALP